MTRVAHALGAGLVALLAGATTWAEEPAEDLSSEKAAARFLIAFRAGDDAAMRSLAEAHDPDPFRVVNRLLCAHAREARAGSGGRGDALDAALAFADLAKERKGVSSLPAFAAAWIRKSPQALEEVLRLQALVDRLDSGDSDLTPVSAAEAGAADLREGMASVPSCEILLEVATHHSTAGRSGEAVRWSARGAADARILGWSRMERLFRTLEGVETFKSQGPEAALAPLREATALADALGDPDSVVQAHGVLAYALKDCGEVAAALPHFEAAAARAGQSGLRELENQFLEAVATTLTGVGEVRRAIPILERVWEADRAAGNRRGAALALVRLGQARAMTGAFSEGLRELDQAESELRAVDDRAGAAWATMHAASALLKLRAFESALSRAERAMAEFEALRDRSGLGKALSFIGAARQQLGEGAVAMTFHRRALAEFEAVGDAVSAEETLGLIGACHLELGEYASGLQALEQALKKKRARGDRDGAASVLNNIGAARYEMGEFETAMDVLAQSLAEREALGLLPEACLTRENLAEACSRAGRHEQAVQMARDAMRSRVEFGSGLAETEGFQAGGQLRRPAAAALRSLRAMAVADPESAVAMAERAFETVELSRAMRLVELLGQRQALVDALVPGPLAEQDAAARLAVESARAVLQRRNARPGTPPEEIRAARENLDRAYRRSVEVVDLIQRETKRAAGLLRPRPVPLDALRARIPAGTAMLLYHQSAQRIYAVLITAAGIAFEDLAESDPTLDRARAWLSRLSRGEDDEEEAGTLYDALLRPMEPRLAGVERILVSPDGVLAFLPFDALLRREAEGRVRVLDRWEVTCVPSATVYAALREEERGPRGEGVIALGDPTYPGESEERGSVAAVAALRGWDRPERLVASGEEARAVAALFKAERRVLLLREEATAAELRKALAAQKGRLRAVHLACHGLLDAERPRLSGLLLAEGQGLSLDDVFRMAIPADLAVLSACDTGRGSVRRGEGVQGLVRCFFVAGVPRVVVSNWQVADEGTRDLMVSFYRNMILDGVPPSAALRSAKQAMLRGGGDRAHPRHWAAFVLWGLPD